MTCPDKTIFGIDISKLTFDAHCYQSARSKHFTNDKKGHTAFKKWCAEQGTGQQHPGQPPLIVLEHTGHYSFGLEQYLEKHHLPFHKHSGLDIRRSMGIQRGKSDATDAAAIARFAYQRRDEIRADVPKTAAELRLSQLNSLRNKMVADRAGYQVRLSELEAALGKAHAKEAGKAMRAIIAAFEGQLTRLEVEIRQLLHTEKDYERTLGLVSSVKGIGPVIATHLIIATRNFTAFEDWRSFAAWAGVAPFAYQSGTSIRGRTKVSHLANKKMKSLLHQAAIIAVIHDAQLRAYFERKIAEGKPKMSVYNAVRAKLLARVFAVVKRGTNWEADNPKTINPKQPQKILFAR